MGAGGGVQQDIRFEKIEPGLGSKKKPRAPGRKFLAAGTGSGLGGYVSIIVAYHFPHMPSTVTAAYTGLVISFMTLLLTYLVPPE